MLDLDGTLVDTVETRIRAWLAVFEEFDIPATRAMLAPMIGIDGKRLARDAAEAAGRPLPPGRDEEIDRRCGEIYESLNQDPQALARRTELLRWLDAQAWPWAIATSSGAGRDVAGGAGLGRDPTIVDGSSVAHAKPARTCCWQRRHPAAAAVGLLVHRRFDLGHARGRRGRHAPVGVTEGAAVDADALREAGAVLVLDTLMELRAELHRRRGGSV